MRQYKIQIRSFTTYLIFFLLLSSCDSSSKPWERFADNKNVRLEYDQLGQVVAAKAYNKNGELHGLVERYRENGEIASRRMFKNGLENGRSYFYYPELEVKVEIDFVNGLPHGDYRSYYQGGELRRTKKFIDGLPVEKSIAYFSNGQIQAVETYKNGLLHGVMDYFDETGKVVRRSHFVLGKRLHDDYPGSNDPINRKQGS